MARGCDFCEIGSAVTYCRADAVYLCVTCDGKIHGSSHLASRHERVTLCGLCERCPAAVTCKADAAALCIACDAEIHSANPLASRHERVAVMPLADVVVPSSYEGEGEEEEAEGKVAHMCYSHLIDQAWLRRGHAKALPASDEKLKAKDLRFPPDLGFAGEGVAPVQNPVLEAVVPGPDASESGLAGQLDAQGSGCHGGNISNAALLNHTMSSSPGDAWAVPEGVLHDTSMLAGTASAHTFQDQSVCRLGPIEREARVLRYREKKKNRKFEKQIRYASRKAHAETRPRMKGRFTKRFEAQVDQMFSGVPDGGFGVVPTL